MKVTIARQALITSTNPANPTGKDTIIEYVTEAGRIGTVIIAGAEPTPDQVAAAIKSDQEHTQLSAGRTIDI